MATELEVAFEGLERVLPELLPGQHAPMGAHFLDARGHSQLLIFALSGHGLPLPPSRLALSPGEVNRPLRAAEGHEFDRFAKPAFPTMRSSALRSAFTSGAFAARRRELPCRRH